MNALVKTVTTSSLRREHARNLLAEIAPGARFAYQYTTKSGKPTTIAYIFDDQNQKIVFNAAKCSKKDNFSRAEGRLTAARRLRTNRNDHPNGTIPYADVSWEGKPRYRLIAEALLRAFEGQ